MINKEQIDIDNLSKEEQKQIVAKASHAFCALLYNKCKIDRMNFRNALVMGANIYCTSFIDIDIVKYVFTRTWFGDRVMFLVNENVVKVKTISWFVTSINLRMKIENQIKVYQKIIDSKILGHEENIDNVKVLIDTLTRYGKTKETGKGRTLRI